jgi:hypothetical protein
MLTILVWIVAGFLLLLGFATDAFQEQDFYLFGRQLHVTLIPLWPFMCGISLGSGSAATAFVILATRKDAHRHHVLTAWCAGIVVPLIPALILAVNRMWQTVPVALAWVAASAMVIVYVNVLRRAPRPWLGLLLASLVAVGWLPVILINIRAVAALGADWPRDPNELVELLTENTSIQTFAFSFALFFVAIMTAAGVALAARSRSTLPDRLQAGAHWRRTAVLCLIAIVIIAVEVTGIGGLSSGFYAGYWGLRSAGTWPHALIVAALIAFTAERSWHSPLIQRGDVFTTVVVGIGALAGDLVLGVVMTVSLIVGAIKGTFTVIPPPVDDLDLVIMWLALLALIPFAVRPAQYGTAGQWVARVALLYLVPAFVGVTASQTGFAMPFSFWATPAQVAICLVVIGCVATALGLMTRRTLLHQKVASRVVIIPLLIVAGTSWLPTFLSHPLTPYIAIVAALFTLLWAMPPVAADKERHSGVVLAASAQLLLVTAAAAIAATKSADLTSGDPTLDLLFFSVPLSALLCARVTRNQPEAVPRLRRVRRRSETSASPQFDSAAPSDIAAAPSAGPQDETAVSPSASTNP